MTIRSVQLKHLKNLLQVGNDEQLIHSAEKIHPADISVLFLELNDVQIKRLVDCLFLMKKAAMTFKELPEFMLPDILELISSERIASMLNRLDTDDAAYFLGKIPPQRHREILDKVDLKIRMNLEKVLLYPPRSAGSVMNPDFFSVPVDSTVEWTVSALQKFSGRESIFYIYVVEGKQLVGVLPLRTMAISDPKTPVRDIMKKTVIMVQAMSDQEEAAQMVSQYKLLALPVVNENKELLGVITVDDVIDIFEQEATEDIYNMAGLSGEDRAFTPVLIKIKKRLPWLFINLCTAFLAASVVGMFEKTINQFAILAAYMPVVAGLGGNGGTQSMVVITRSIALGEMDLTRSYQAVFKEVLNGLCLGAVAGLVAAGVAYFVNVSPFLGLILFLSMVVNMVLAGLMGSCVPLTLKKLNLDPAVGAGIFVTASTDITGFLVFLSFANYFADKL